MAIDASAKQLSGQKPRQSVNGINRNFGGHEVIGAAEETRLTDEDYWDHFWSSLKLPSRVNSLSSFDRGLSRAFLRMVPNGQGKRLIEIGAAPGRWLIFLQEKFGYEVDGIEYVPSACRKTEENLAVCGIKGTIFQQDFFHNDLPKHSYDVVLSLGFIEHFTDLAPVINGHIDLLKPGGHLILGVPNLRGVHGAIERHTDPNTFTAHNLNVMSISFMENLSSQYSLVPLSIQYIGGINPGLITIAEDTNKKTRAIAAVLHRTRINLVRFTLRFLSFVRNRTLLLDHLNNSYVSNYLLAVYKYTPSESGGGSKINPKK